MTNWFGLALISVNFFSIVSLLDKYLCAQKFKSVYSLSIINYFLTAIFIVLLAFIYPFPLSLNVAFLSAFLSGVVYFLMWIFIWKALTKGEVSRSTAIFNSMPIFNAFLAVVFLGETLTAAKWIAILFIVIGAIISSWENETHRKFNPIYLYAVLAAVMAAVGNVLTKFALKELGPFQIYQISFVAVLPLYWWLYKKREISMEVKTHLGNRASFSLLFLRSFISFSAVSFLYLAFAAGPISLVASINGISPLLVFIYSAIISLFFPKFIKEELHRRALFSKTVAIIFVITGVYLINS